jgi:hypothetical protein
MARGAIQRSGGKPGGHPPVHAKRKGRLVSEIVPRLVDRPLFLNTDRCI